jgi:outer membrane receptor protein involved in Fe transport
LPYTATIDGMEFEAEIVTPQGISLKGNITHIDAVLNYYDSSQQPVKSQLPFQPSLIANATLSYEYEPWNIVASLVYNYNGAYPVILKETEAQSEVTREAIQTFDFFLSKTWENEWVDTTVRFGVKNLLNAEDRYVYADRTYSNDVIGRTYQFEILARF